MKTALSDLDTRVASTVDEALTILRDERRVPIAGATDVFVALNFGLLPHKSYLDIWALDELRMISTHEDTLSIGAPRGSASSPARLVRRSSRIRRRRSSRSCCGSALRNVPLTVRLRSSLGTTGRFGSCTGGRI